MCDHDIVSLGKEIVVFRLFRMCIVCGFINKEVFWLY